MLWVDHTSLHVEIDTISYGNFVKAGQAHGDDGRTSSSRPGWPSPDEGWRPAPSILADAASY